MTAGRIPHPGVRFPPPTLFLAGFAAGWLLHRWQPLPLPGGRTAATASGGWLLIALGLALMLWALVTFLGARTAVLPHRPAARLVRSGPYRRSRNPMYVGLTAVYVGGVLLTGMLWPLLLLPIVLAALATLVIAREERYLADAFGAEYAEYRRRVRRWL